MFKRTHSYHEIANTMCKKCDRVRKEKVFPHLYPMYQPRKADPNGGPVDLKCKPRGLIEVKL